MRILISAVVVVVVGAAAGAGTAFVRVRMTEADLEVMLQGAAVRSEDLPKPGEPHGVVVIDETEFDFGAMDDDVSMSHEFVFCNEGNATLKLTKGDTTCRCTVVDMEEVLIPPGESAPVKIEWTSNNEAGPYRQTATIFTNDPSRPRVTLTIQGTVMSAVRVDPSDLVFRGLTVDQTATAEVRVLSYLAEDFQIAEHAWDDPKTARNFHVTYRPLSSDELKDEPDVRSGYVVKVTVEPGLPLGPFRQKIHLKTNLEDSPTVEVPVEGTVGSDISIVGRGWNEKNGVLTFGTVGSKQGAERRVQLLCRGPLNADVAYEIAAVEPSWLEVELGEKTMVNEGRVALTPLTVTIPKGAEPAVFLGARAGDFGRITIETNHPQAPQLRILVRFAVER